MKQQINLYQAEFRQPEIALSADHIFMGAGGLLLLMVLGSAGLALSNMFADHRLAALKVEVETLKQGNTQIDSQLQGRAVDQTLAGSAANAARQLQSRQDILQLVQRSEQRKDTVHFSELLAGLARQHVSGMWLTRIDISASGQEMHLEGSTLNAKLVPEFVGKLGQEPVYAGREFRKVMIQRNVKDASLLDFVLTTGDPDSEGLLAFMEKIKSDKK
jgi:MSHA biogenesis protein MshI